MTRQHSIRSLVARAAPSDRAGALCVALVVLGLLALPGAAAKAACGDSWGPVARGQAWLSLRAPDLLDIEPSLRCVRRGWQHTEHGVWQSRTGLYPRAEVVLRRVDDLLFRERTFVWNDSVADRAREVLGARIASLGSSGEAFNDFEDLEYQLLDLVDGARCIYLRQGRSTIAENLEVIGSGRPVGDMVLEAWYCTDSRTPDLEPQFAGFARGIGVRGYAVPEAPHPDARLEPRRR